STRPAPTAMPKAGMSAESAAAGTTQKTSWARRRANCTLRVRAERTSYQAVPTSATWNTRALSHSTSSQSVASHQKFISSKLPAARGQVERAHRPGRLSAPHMRLRAYDVSHGVQLSRVEERAARPQLV